MQASDGSIYAGAGWASATVYIDPVAAKVFKTTDCGKTWAEMGPLVGNDWYSNVSCLLQSSDGAIFAGATTYDGIPLEHEHGAVFISEDMGKHWSQTGELDGSRSVNILIQTRDNSVWVGTWAGIFRTTDNGKTWHNMTSHGVTSNVYSLLETLSGALCAGGPYGNILVTTNGGFDWTYTGFTLSLKGAAVCGEVNCLIENPDGSVYSANGSTIFKTMDGGQSWENLVDLGWNCSTTGREKITLLQARDGSIYAGTSATTGIFRTTNGGISWEWAGNVPGGVTCFLQSRDGAIYAGSASGDVFKAEEGVHLNLSSNSVSVGESFRAEIAAQPIDQIFDVWGIIIGGGSSYSFTLADPSVLQNELRPMVSGVPGLLESYSRTIFSIPAVPPGAEGDYRIIVGLVDRGKTPRGIEDAIPGYVSEMEVTVSP
ncbi:MAG: hypothetical protein NTZ78_15005 [Candidatus Aureabacteria bacterium]|nr:hypothetical protein [Candidatus Auribacterota bacterium]